MPVHRQALGAIVTASIGAALVEALPSVLILPALSKHPPEAFGMLCRWRGPSHAEAAAVTFDDGPDIDTRRTLDVLDDVGLRATFFLLGAQIAAHPDIAREIASRGHEVGTHGFVHRHHLLSSPREIGRDLDRAVATHRAVLDASPRFFRPPYGQLTLASLLAARPHRLETVLWSASAREWATDTAEAALARLGPGLGPGAIVLLHDNDVSCPRGTGELTRSLLGPLATRLQAHGLRGVSIGEMLDEAQAGSGSGSGSGSASGGRAAA
jgi:peptidoglycan-N-acetylglucosamine deacetylase